MTVTAQSQPAPAAPRRRRRFNPYLFAAAVLGAACLGMVGWLMVERGRTDALLSQRAAEVVAHVEEWTPEERAAELAKAHAYNEGLLRNGVVAIGQAVDPFTGVVLADADEAYQSTLLVSENGLIGRVVVPRIGVDLPVNHGTDDASMRRGVGHLYGTSLPAGGPGTHTVLSTHSGQLTETGFMRLGELRRGDFLYIQVMGETLGYVVDRITVISPDDFSHFRILPDEDRLTLMTCTPVGINTERLLVSGVRAPIPDVVPEIEAVTADGNVPHVLLRAGAVALGVILAGAVLVTVIRRRRKRRADATAE